MAKKQKISRRDFLRSTVTGAGVAALGLTGCAAGSASQSTQPAAAPEVVTEIREIEKVGYEVIDAGDLLIVGSGMAATAMARYAMRKGKHVTILDKAPYGFGGASGYNWDIYTTVMVTGEHPEYRCQDGSNGLVNAAFVNNAVMFDPIKDDVDLEFLKRGQILPCRKEDGTNSWYYEVQIPNYYILRGIEGNMVRLESDDVKASPMLKIYEQKVKNKLQK